MPCSRGGITARRGAKTGSRAGGGDVTTPYNAVKRKMERKRSNQLKDFQHKTAKKLVENTKAGTIIIGDLSVKEMPKSQSATRQMYRSTQGAGYLARFAGFLTYKAILA